MSTDYHLHTPLCHHAVGTPREYVLAAQAIGLEEIGFSDHNPMPVQFDDWRMAPEELSDYLQMVQEVRREFPHYPIRLGLECDFIPGYEDHIRYLAGATDWDYLIGSVHYITPDWDVDNPKHLKRFTDQPVEEIWTSYFAAFTGMIESRLFDFYGHPDLVKKFGHRPAGDLARFYTATMDALADCGGVLEINTAGLRKDVREIYPSKQFLVMAHKRNIPIVINSDSHAPGEVGYAFKEAYALAKEVGYESTARFQGRKATFTPF